MLLTGIVGREGIGQTANLISTMFSSKGKKVSMIDSSNLTSLDSYMVRQYLQELRANGTDALVFKISISDIVNSAFDGLHFDIIIYTDKADELNEGDKTGHRDLVRRIFSLLDEKGTMIVNVDDIEVIKMLEGMKYHTVTYGFNSKASITTSSTGDLLFDNNVICCLQRTVTAKNGVQIEPQEYRVCVDDLEYDTRNVLAAVTFAVINGLDPSSMETPGARIQ